MGLTRAQREAAQQAATQTPTTKRGRRPNPDGLTADQRAKFANEASKLLREERPEDYQRLLGVIYKENGKTYTPKPTEAQKREAAVRAALETDGDLRERLRAELLAELQSAAPVASPESDGYDTPELQGPDVSPETDDQG